jgi:hypothetical protein
MKTKLTLDITHPNVSHGSTIKVWWQCQKYKEDEWQSSIASRTSMNSGCPFCSGHKVSNRNCLANMFPKIAAEWHPTKNGHITPYDVSYGSNKVVWWQDSEHKENAYKKAIFRKTRDACSMLHNHSKKVNNENCLIITHPEIIKSWHPTKNGNDIPANFTSGSDYKIWWICEYGDEWKISINARTRYGCPYCSGKNLNSRNCLAAMRPDIAREWHATKNGNKTPYDFTVGTNYSAWWLCNICKKDYDAPIIHRCSRGSGCPYCVNKKVCSENCLATINPKIAAEWHPTKNKDITPYDIVSGSHSKRWWMCSKNNQHEWLVSPNSRIKKNGAHGCPFCSRKSEQIISDILKDSGFIFSRNEPIINIIPSSRRVLKMDFYLPILNIILEYDGDQHYRPVDFYGMGQDIADQNFDKQKRRDKHRARICKNNNIELIIIDGRKYRENNLKNYMTNIIIPKLLQKKGDIDL